MRTSRIAVAAFLAVAGLLGGRCFAQAPTPAPGPSAQAAPAAEVKNSTPTPAVGTLYTGDKVRNPFLKSVSGGGGGGGCKPEEFSIHLLNLRAMMKDPGADYAVLTDACGALFIFRKGRLLDAREKPIAGVTGWMNIAQKTLTLQTAEKDVQVFRLGEQLEEEKK